MKNPLIVIAGGANGNHVTTAKRIPSSVSDPVILADAHTRDRILLAKVKTTHEIWLFQEGEQGWIPWGPLDECEVQQYYAAAPRLQLVTSENSPVQASA